MLAHEPPERGSLVRRVVVDVQVGVDAAARLDPVDEALERGLLAVAVEAPDDLVAHLAALAVAPAEEVLEPARRLVERVALEVEPDVALGRRREQPEAAVLLVREELDAPLARAREVELERGLARGCARRSPAGCARPSCRARVSPSAVSVVIPCGDEPLRVQPAEPGDE